MGKRGQQKATKKKLTKKEKKRLNHLKLMQGKKNDWEPQQKNKGENKKAA